MKDLMVAVERAVRPVQAHPARKRRMRQELLAHLTGIFEEERARGGDEQLALAQALRRFGNPEELTRELQASVPFLERHLSGVFFRRPGERRLWHALRIAALGAVTVFASMFLIPLIRVAAGDDWSNARIGLASVGVLTGYVFVSVLLGYAICWELAERLSATSLLRTVVYAAATLLVGVGLIVAESVAQSDNPLWAFLLHSPRDPLAVSALVWITATPLVLSLFAAVVVRVDRARERRQGDWMSLEIGA